MFFQSDFSQPIHEIGNYSYNCKMDKSYVDRVSTAGHRTLMRDNIFQQKSCSPSAHYIGLSQSFVFPRTLIREINGISNMHATSYAASLANSYDLMGKDANICNARKPDISAFPFPSSLVQPYYEVPPIIPKLALNQRRCKRCKCPSCEESKNDLPSKLKKKQHVCCFPGCNKIYWKTTHLQAHLRLHSGERPFVCNWMLCNKSFTRSDELRRHIRTHTGEKKFACTECGKRFIRSDHLSKHIKTHLKEKNKVQVTFL